MTYEERTMRENAALGRHMSPQSFWAIAEINRLSAEVQRLRETCDELVTDSNAITLAASLARVSIENAQIRETLSVEAVYDALSDANKRYTSRENVSAVLGAISDIRHQARAALVRGGTK